MNATDRYFYITTTVITVASAVIIRQNPVGIFGLSANETKKLCTAVAVVNLGLLALGLIASHAASKIK